MVPDPYYSMYDPSTIPEDPAFNEFFTNKPVHQKHVSQMWGVYDLPWKEWQKIIARYYGYITLIDEQIGRFINFLKGQGYICSSVIVFTADRGERNGIKQGCIEKGGFMYDSI